MVRNALIFCLMFLSFCLSGCAYNDEPMAEIVSDYRSHIPEAPEAKIQPEIHTTTNAAEQSFSGNVPARWIPPRHLEKKWKAIVIHHSGTKNGSAAIFDKWHKQNNHWEGVGYDFVIGNGADSGDGQVEVTFRWRKQKTGAHCGGTKGNWANRNAIGICLVGNFNHTVPTSRQMKSLVRLVGFLQRRYNIPKSRVYGHNTTPGARPTDCPGKRFPMAKFKTLLDF